ncbi:hypothetical protein BELL_0440g00020 [Botrytis elliptica]|uniref:Uncharacterized protein n=1 Tax=Botrytis elliptica TaxID=278938 RepID=A0A4Z1JGF9_9HELO|nr:hypothetical protein BELL_0440g00020 [Botrytis elliptica]
MALTLAPLAYLSYGSKKLPLYARNGSKRNTYVVIVDENIQTSTPTCDSKLACHLNHSRTRKKVVSACRASRIREASHLGHDLYNYTSKGLRSTKREERKCFGAEIFIGGYQLANTPRSSVSFGRHVIGA